MRCDKYERVKLVSYGLVIFPLSYKFTYRKFTSFNPKNVDTML